MKIWFENITWEHITRINAAACAKGDAQHGFSESQGPRMKKLWEEKAQTPMTFWDVLELCRKLHEGAPFFNFNGNTFASLAAEASRRIKHPNQFLLEDNICNAIAGSLSANAEKKLRDLSATLERGGPPMEI